MKNKILLGDCLKNLKKFPDNSIDCVVTSPPYWALRDYDVAGQLGLEKKYMEYVSKLCDIFDEIKRVLKNKGTCWVNIGDTYLKTSLCQIPSHFAIEMCNRGWILRNEIIWHKPNAMPSSVKDRFTVDFEKVFFFTKSKKYYFEQQLQESSNKADVEYRRALRREKSYTMKKPYAHNFPKSFREDGKRNMRAVWSIATKPFVEAHFATYPEALIEPMIQGGCPIDGIVLDPFFGSGTTGVVAIKNNRKYVGIELNPEYIKIAKKRLAENKK